MAVITQNGGTNGGIYASYFSGRLTVTETSYSVSNNTSTLSYKLELISGSSGRFSDYGANYSVSINGSVVKSGSGSYDSQSYNTAQTICEGTTIVTHNADGTKNNMAISAVLDFASGDYSPGDFNLSGTMNLTPLYTKATISSAPNFELGSNETVTYSNPGSLTTVIGIFNTAGNVAYAAYRTCTGSSYSFSFTDAELDALYKAMGTGNTLTARVYLRTTISGSSYYDYKDVTITLKGNQKTIREKVSGTWRRGKVWIKVSGTWRRGVVWEKISGTWRRGI